MDNNLFSDKQIEYMYSDSRFLSFINQYFSSFSTQMQSIDYSIKSGEIDDIDLEIYLRIVLANIDTLHSLISDLESCLSMAQVDREVVFAGEIQGRLNIGKYTKNIAQASFPREYPCVVKSRTYASPENIYVIFIINNILKMLDEFKRFLISKGNSSFSELNLIEHHFRAFKQFSTKAYFKDCQDYAKQIMKSYGDRYPDDLQNLILTRIHKGKIRNSHVYQRIFDWYNTYKYGSVLELSAQKLSVLRYSDDFANRLFELWCLYCIKETFVSSFDAILLEENNIMSAGDRYIYKLSVPTGGTLEIYYQKGANLYWDTENDLIWKYVKDGNTRGLRGIPDISIRYTAKEDSLVMIDIKNRVRTAGANSEEIYKMIGYFGNFKKTFEERFSSNVKKQGALIFRNDFKPSDEYLESDSGYKLMTISAGVSDNPEINTNQFKKLCKYVLDVQGIDGTTSEIMGGFSQAQKKIGVSVDSESAEYIFELNERNHATIQQLFSYGDLAKQLPNYKDKLKVDHFPHVWNSLSEKTQDILAMAECLYSGVSPCETADYAPICLEYCRAIEVEMNELIFSPFKAMSNVNLLAQHNHFYDKLRESRDMTLGECVFLLDKCSHRTHPLVELRRKIQQDIKHNSKLLGDSVDILRDLNETIRRLSAHTTVMTYDDLVMTRQRVIGIGNLNLFYVLRDSR